MDRRVIYLGGNGHCAARLGPARDALARAAADFALIDVAYPGFENRPRAQSFDAFLASISASIHERAQGQTILYGTGIGGLLALCLRARGEWLDIPLLIQAPVLWGLEHRLMPRVLRIGFARRLLHWVFARRWFQRRFVGKYFLQPMSAELQAAFFAGYAQCSAAGDLFAWLTPALLRELEKQFAGRPERLAAIRVWWGERDQVVNLQELAWTEKALGVHWPTQTFPHWGHYPMLDAPDEWVRALNDVLASFDAIPRSLGPQA